MMLAILLKVREKKNVDHIWYDFHNETGGDQFHKLNDLLFKIKDSQKQFGFFAFQKGGQIL